MHNLLLRSGKSFFVTEVSAMFELKVWQGRFRSLICVAAFVLLSASTQAVSDDGAKDKATINGPAERVKAAKKLLTDGGTYPKECSEFVSKVLGIPWESANKLMGDAPTKVGVDGTYTGLKPGDIVGWKKDPHGHVAVYIGDNRFIDVREDGEKPRTLASYGGQPLFKSFRF
jgi:cell wall-associated NlpC family hydrolase